MNPAHADAPYTYTDPEGDTLAVSPSARYPHGINLVTTDTASGDQVHVIVRHEFLDDLVQAMYAAVKCPATTRDDEWRHVTGTAGAS